MVKKILGTGQILKKRLISFLLVIAIIGHGIFKIHILKFYSALLKSISFLDSDAIIAAFNKISTREAFIDYYLGWIIYFPTYTMLHFTLVLVLFRDDKKARNMVLIGLVSVIIACLLLILVGQQFDIKLLNSIGYDTLKKIIGLPFILLFIEAGKILYEDVKKINLDDHKH